jgi:hypothetical protein
MGNSWSTSGFADALDGSGRCETMMKASVEKSRSKKLYLNKSNINGCIIPTIPSIMPAIHKRVMVPIIFADKLNLRILDFRF